METEKKCPLCGNECELNDDPYRSNYYFTKQCSYTKILHIDGNLISQPDSESTCSGEYEKKSNMIFSDLIAHRNKDKGRLYSSNSKSGTLYEISDDSVCVYVPILMKDYPTWMQDMYDLILLNLYNLHFGRPVLFLDELNGTRKRIFMADDDYIVLQMKDALIEYGYLVEKENTIYFTKQGLDRIRELKKDDGESKTVFVAMAFEGTDNVYKAISDAISEAGYSPVRIDKVEHNNQIMPEIFGQIRKCRFLVMDLTKPNFGAYYEAGIARGMGKETILTCKSDAFHKNKDTPHFDVAQQSTVLWNDSKDLEDKLVNRIRATID